MELFSQWTALAALAVVAVQQILKLNVIPVYFANNYPVATNVVLSVIASAIANASSKIALTNVWQWLTYVATVSVVAAITYNQTLKQSDYVQAISDKKSA